MLETQIHQGEKNEYLNCEVGIDFGNRMIARKQFAHVEIKKQDGMGFGLTAVVDIKSGKGIAALLCLKDYCRVPRTRICRGCNQ